MNLRDLARDTRIELAAIDEARNCRRSYRIERVCDLFGYHLVEWCWGRTATPGRAQRATFATEEEAVRFVRGLLRRRESALKRIGVAYRAQPACPIVPMSDRATPPAPEQNNKAEPAGRQVRAEVLQVAQAPLAGPGDMTGCARPLLVELRYRFLSFDIWVRQVGYAEILLSAGARCPSDVLARLAQWTAGVCENDNSGTAACDPDTKDRTGRGTDIGQRADGKWCLPMEEALELVRELESAAPRARYTAAG